MVEPAVTSTVGTAGISGDAGAAMADFAVSVVTAESLAAAGETKLLAGLAALATAVSVVAAAGRFGSSGAEFVGVADESVADESAGAGPAVESSADVTGEKFDANGSESPGTELGKAESPEGAPGSGERLGDGEAVGTLPAMF